MKENRYKRISKEKEGILYYTKRILPNQNVTVVGRMTNVMKDLQQTSFCVPIIDKHSPLAYSIVNEIHWYNNIAKQRYDVLHQLLTSLKEERLSEKSRKIVTDVDY